MEKPLLILLSIKFMLAGLMPVILTTQEAEIMRIKVQSQLQANSA
jgi:hypothetical protein